MGSGAAAARVLAGVAAATLAIAACTGGGRSVDPAPRVIEPTVPAATPAAPALALEPGWQAVDPGPLAGRVGAAAVWTGDEVLIWGGRNDEGSLRDGAAFDPETGGWRLLSPTRFSARAWPVAVWTGSEMVVIGGVDGDDRSLSGAAAYDPAADAWREVDLAWSAVAPLSDAVWTGGAVVVVGAVPPPTGDPSADVIALDPVEGFVTALTPYGEPARRGVAVRWDGDAVVTVTVDDATDVVVRRLDPATGRVLDETTAVGVRGLDVDPNAVATVGDIVVVPVHDAVGALFSDGPPTDLESSGSATRWPAAVVGTLVSYGDVVLDVESGEWNDAPLPDANWDRQFPVAVSTGDAIVVWGGDACGRVASCSGLVHPDQTLIWVPGLAG